MNLSTAFSYKIMQEMARYLVTQNLESQTLAVDANSVFFQTTGTGQAMFDGDLVVLAADAVVNTAAGANESLTAWETETTYTVSTTTPVYRKNSDAEGSDVRFRLIKTHTSAADNEPLVGSRWEEYWVREPNGWSTALDAVVGYGNTRCILVLAERDGTCHGVLAGDQQASSATPNFTVPQFDPHKYCPIGMLHVNYHHTSGNWTYGTDAFNATNCTTTYVDFVGANIMPDVSLINKS